MAISLSTFTISTTSFLFISLPFLYPLSTPVTGICKDELVSFSSCLPYTAAPPNNFSDSASTDCCNKFSDIILSGNGFCLCYLVDDPYILGFPVNTSRILSLSTLCPLTPGQTNALRFICLDLKTPPPIQSPVSGQWNHSNSGELASGPTISPTTMDSVPKSAGSSQAPPDYSFEASSASIISSGYHWFLP